VARQVPRRGRVAVLTACLVLAACNQAAPTPPKATGPTTPPGSPSALPSAGAVVSPLPSGSAAASPPGASGSPTASPDGAVATPVPVGAGASVETGPDGLRVVESGFTAFFSDGNDFASFAAVIDNPNEGWAVFQMQITIDFFDVDDNFIAGEEQFVQVLPGQRTAIAGEAFGAGRATRMTVNIPDDTSAYEPYSVSGDLFRVAGAETSRDNGLNVTTGRLTSRATRTESLVQLTAVYRNGRGAIIGGTVGGVDSIEPGATIPFEVIDGAPLGAIADTEVYWQVSGVRR
jgi:hypothetical protein